MSKLSQSDFGHMLELVHKADQEQLADLERFIKVHPDTQQLILKLAHKSVIARSVKDGLLIDDKTSKKDVKVQISKDGVKPKKRRGGRVRKPVEIFAPNGCSFNETIPFTIEKFDKWLQNKGIKSSLTYSAGMKGLLKNAGFAGMNEITLLALRTVRDSVSSDSKSDGNRRLWLKKFNMYLAYEYEKKMGNVN